MVIGENLVITPTLATENLRTKQLETLQNTGTKEVTGRINEENSMVSQLADETSPQKISNVAVTSSESTDIPVSLAKQQR